MKGKFKFSKEERDLLRNSIDSFQNDVVKESLNGISGAGHSKAHITASWERSANLQAL